MFFQYRDILLGNSQLMIITITIVVFILINIVLGFTMIYKGIKSKTYVYSYIGAIFFAGVSAWGGVLYNFIYILITDAFPVQIWTSFFVIQGGFLFVFHIIWIYGVTKISKITEKQRKTLMIVVVIFNAILELTYWIIILTDVSILGTPSFPFIVTYSPVSYFYLTSSLMFFTIAGGWIAIVSFKEDDPKIKLRGKFLIVYVILITVGSILEIYDPLETLMVGVLSMGTLDAAVIASLIAKVLLTIAVISGYLGFMLPKQVQKIFIKA